MLCGTDNMFQNILHIQSKCQECFVEYCQSHIVMHNLLFVVTTLNSLVSVWLKIAWIYLRQMYLIWLLILIGHLYLSGIVIKCGFKNKFQK